MIRAQLVEMQRAIQRLRSAAQEASKKPQHLWPEAIIGRSARRFDEKLPDGVKNLESPSPGILAASSSKAVARSSYEDPSRPRHPFIDGFIDAFSNSSSVSGPSINIKNSKDDEKCPSKASPAQPRRPEVSPKSKGKKAAVVETARVIPPVTSCKEALQRWESGKDGSTPLKEMWKTRKSLSNRDKDLLRKRCDAALCCYDIRRMHGEVKWKKEIGERVDKEGAARKRKIGEIVTASRSYLKLEENKKRKKAMMKELIEN